ncbi:hypothetical protein [Actinophytocola sp.]|nr:hypothetical protein [Actinophytocola sp.]
MAVADHDGHATRAVAGVEHAFRTRFGADPYTEQPELQEEQEQAAEQRQT